MDNSRQYIDILRQEVVSGRITADDIIKRLTVVIEAEYAKENPNVEFIDMCENLLWDIGTNGERSFVSCADKYIAAINEYTPAHRRKSRRNTHFGIVKRCAAIAVVFTVVVILSQGVFHLGWFEHHSSHDQQQYIIQGHSIDVDLITHSIAEHDGFATIRTSNWSELISFLGFEPSIIDPSALEADAIQYTVFIDPSVIMLIAQYSLSSTDGEVLMTIQYFADIDEAYFVLEQDAEGEEVIQNGTEIYVSSNIDRNSFTWIDGAVIYKISGDLSKECGYSIIDEISGGK